MIINTSDGREFWPVVGRAQLMVLVNTSGVATSGQERRAMSSVIVLGARTHRCITGSPHYIPLYMYISTNIIALDIR